MSKAISTFSSLSSQTSNRRQELKKLLRDIWESISGTELDFTTGKLSRAILLLSIPMVLEMIMESIFAVVDIFFVSRLGADAVATVGITESLITIVYAVAVGLSMATTAMVSRRIGEKKASKAAEVSFQAIITGLASSFLLAWIGWFYATDVLMLMGVSAGVAHEMSGYTAWMLVGGTDWTRLDAITGSWRPVRQATR